MTTTIDNKISFDVILIGAGPAGSMAAGFLARQKWRTLLVDKEPSRHFLDMTKGSPLFPGWEETAASVEIQTSTITSIESEITPFTLVTGNGERMNARAIVVATGASERNHSFPGEHELSGKGVFYDVHFDGPEASGKNTVIVGKTHEAAEAALHLTTHAEKVFFVVPSSKLDVRSDLMKKLEQSGKIEILFSASLKQINGSSRVESVAILSAGEERAIPITSLYLYIHDFIVGSSIVKDRVQLGEHDVVMVDETMATSTKGIFACGDVIAGRPQIPLISAAQGMIAGINVDKYLRAIEKT